MSLQSTEAVEPGRACQLQLRHDAAMARQDGQRGQQGSVWHEWLFSPIHRIGHCIRPEELQPEEAQLS